jgi:hypothetical protein
MEFLIASIRLHIVDLPQSISKCDQPVDVVKLFSPAHQKLKGEVYTAAGKLSGESYTHSDNVL